ncbi:cytochrome P450 family protein [Mycobacterium asiaticum]|uniref:cytochrome P450 n=1 Tax=Mycobacterium asiaticum TaxID=1790 RepID=UPI00115474AE|nr:cytochrome P450 [Mycobacterium asiaticum]
MSDDFVDVMALDRGRGFRLLSAQGPVFTPWEGTYVLTRREDILAVLRNPELTVSARTSPVTGLPLDKRQHDLFVKLFDRAATSVMTVVIRESAREVIEHVAGGQGCDGIADVALPFVSSVLQGICDLDPDDAYVELVETHDGAGSLHCLDMAEGVIAARRENPGGDIISRMLVEAPELPDQEIDWLTSQFVCPATIFIATPLGHALLELARRPELRDRLRGNPKDQPVFVNEMLRLEGSAMAGARTVAPLTVAGVNIPVGSTLHLWMALLNRDGSDEFSTDELRMDGRHRQYAFGVGPRRCPAAHFVRTVLAVFVDEWLCRIPTFDVDPDCTPRVYYPDRFLGSVDLMFVLRELPLRWPVTGLVVAWS